MVTGLGVARRDEAEFLVRAWQPLRGQVPGPFEQRLRAMRPDMSDERAGPVNSEDPAALARAAADVVLAIRRQARDGALERPA